MNSYTTPTDFSVGMDGGVVSADAVMPQVRDHLVSLAQMSVQLLEEVRCLRDRLEDTRVRRVQLCRSDRRLLWVLLCVTVLNAAVTLVCRLRRI